MQDPGMAFSSNLVNKFMQFKGLQMQMEFQRRRDERYERQLQQQARQFDITQAGIQARFEAGETRFEAGQELAREQMGALESRFERGQELSREQFGLAQAGIETRHGEGIRIQEEANTIRRIAAGVATEQDKITLTTTMRKEFDALSKDYRTVVASYERVKASGKDPSAAGDLALIFNYMKMLDPGSVVRESEFATAAASGSLGQRWIAVGKNLLAGERLSPAVRADFLDRSRRLFESQQNVQGALINRYTDLAGRFGLSSQDIITEWAPEKQGIGFSIEEQVYSEGQTAIRPETGEKIIFRDGKWQSNEPLFLQGMREAQPENRFK